MDVATVVTPTGRRVRISRLELEGMGQMEEIKRRVLEDNRYKQVFRDFAPDRGPVWTTPCVVEIKTALWRGGRDLDL